jgi:hypothetical protein
MFIEICCQKCQKCNTICVTTFFYWISRLYSFDSGYSLVVLGEWGRWYKRGSDITFFFPKHSFLFVYYHKMILLYSFIISKILVYIFNFFLTNPWNSIEKGCHTNGDHSPIFPNRQTAGESALRGMKIYYYWTNIRKWNYFNTSFIEDFRK